jgi:hypothetical protein
MAFGVSNFVLEIVISMKIGACDLLGFGSDNVGRKLERVSHFISYLV